MITIFWICASVAYLLGVILTFISLNSYYEIQKAYLTVKTRKLLKFTNFILSFFWLPICIVFFVIAVIDEITNI
jgi:hypothetical protein